MKHHKYNILQFVTQKKKKNNNKTEENGAPEGRVRYILVGEAEPVVSEELAYRTV